MRQQFLRVYIGLVLALMVAALAFSLFMVRRFDDEVISRTEEFVAPMITVIREEIAGAIGEPEELDRVLAAINAVSPIPVHFARQVDRILPQSAIDRILSGEVVVVGKPGSRSVYAAVAEGRIIHIGPIPLEVDTNPVLVIVAPVFAILLFIGLSIYVLIRPIERRISTLSQAAKDFGSGDLSRRTKVREGGGFGELEASFNQMAERIQGLVSDHKELLRAVSHDLRTPLARLFFALDDAQNAPDVVDKDRHLKRIDRSLVELNDLVEELLAYLRIEQGRERLLAEHVEPLRVFEDLRSMILELRPELLVTIESNGGGLQADRRLLKRALTNLASNASRYAVSTIALRFHVLQGVPVFEVEDDGPGVPQDEWGRIFEPFVRLDQARTAHAGGSGLGLSIVAKIMEAHKGTVSVASGKLGGALFVLRFQPEPDQNA